MTTAALPLEVSEVPSWVDREAYPFRSRWLPLKEGRVHYVDEGEGEPILFVHGTPTWSFEWRHLIRALSKTNRCVAVDLLGFGLSDRPASADYSPEAHAKRVAEFVEALGLTNFTLVVHDFGGPIALPLALSGKAKRLIVLNSWMWKFDDARMRKRAKLARGRLMKFLYRRFNASLRMLLPSVYADKRMLTKAIHAQYLAPFPDADSRERVLFALAKALLGSSDYYASLWEKRAALSRIPVTVIWGMKDDAFPPAYLDNWVAGVPNARLVRIEDAGHWPHEEQPEQVLAAFSSP